MQKCSLQDQILKNYIDTLFKKYDKHKTGKLNELQMAYLFNELFMELGIHHIVTPSQAKQAMKTFDLNNDGMTDKRQLFYAFKLLMGTPPPQQMFVPHPYYPNNSNDNFHGNECKNMYCPCSHNLKQPVKVYRNTF